MVAFPNPNRVGQKQQEYKIWFVEMKTGSTEFKYLRKVLCMYSRSMEEEVREGRVKDRHVKSVQE